jgi:ribosomal protein S18 acetylase RimI-like enzyme
MTFSVRRLGPADLGLLLALQEQIHAGLPDKSVFQTSTPEFISYCLADGGRCYGVGHEKETVAYRIVYFPRGRDFNLAKDSALPAAEHDRVAHWDTIAVQPAWRGYGLARLMNSTALSELAGTPFRHLFATSSPRNPHGIRSLLEAGFRPIRLLVKFGGKLRFLCYRPTPQGWDTTPAAVRSVPMSATAELGHAFSTGWVGAGVEFASTGPRLHLERRPLPFPADPAGGQA